jgi:hypothetical protein
MTGCLKLQTKTERARARPAGASVTLLKAFDIFTYCFNCYLYQHYNSVAVL